MSITPIDAKNEIKRLEAAGYTVPKVGAEVVAQSWAEEMGSVSRHDLTAAVTAIIRGDSSFWPKIGKLLGMAHDARRARPIDPTRTVPLAEEYRAWEAHVHDELGRPMENGRRGCSGCQAGCPVCRARYEWGAYGYRAIHNEAEHERHGVGWQGWSRADVAFYQASDAARAKVVSERKARERAAEQERLEVAVRMRALLNGPEVRHPAEAAD